MILGIDTASVAGNKKISWTEAKANGLSFAIIRSNYGDQQDTAFQREWPRILDAGLVRGAYLYLRFPRGGKKAPEPEAQARAMVRSIGVVQPSDLPPTMDVEFSGRGRVETGMTVAQAHDWVARAYRVLREEYGVDPLVYTSARVWRDDLGNAPRTELSSCPLWLARYYFKKGGCVRCGAAFDRMPAPPVPPPWAHVDNWWIHQYQGDATDFPGFPTGNVDLNRFNPLWNGGGERVRWVQKRLRVAESGKLDARTGEALAHFQGEHGLVTDRVIGPRTFAYLAWQVV